MSCRRAIWRVAAEHAAEAREVIAEWESTQPPPAQAARAVTKREHYEGGRLISAELDADADGAFERRITYDAQREPLLTAEQDPR